MVRADLHSHSIHKPSNNDVNQEHHLAVFKHVKALHEHVGNISEKFGCPLGLEANFSGTVYR